MDTAVGSAIIGAIKTAWPSVRSRRTLPYLIPSIVAVLVLGYAGSNLPAPPAQPAPTASAFSSFAAFVAVDDSGGRKVDSLNQSGEAASTVNEMTLHRFDSLVKPINLYCDTIIGDTTGRAINREVVVRLGEGVPDAVWRGRDSSYVIIGGDSCIYTALYLGATAGVPDTIRIFNRCNGTATGCIGYIGDEDFTYFSLCDSIRFIDGYGIELSWINSGPPTNKRTVQIELADTVVVPLRFSVLKKRWLTSSTYPDSTSTARWVYPEYYLNSVQWIAPVGRAYRVIGVSWTLGAGGNSLDGGYEFLDLPSRQGQDKGLMVSWVTNPQLAGSPTRTALNDKTRLSFYSADLDQGNQPGIYTHIGMVEIDDDAATWASIGTNNLLLNITVWINVVDYTP